VIRRRLAELLDVPLEETWPEDESLRAGFWRILVEGSEVLLRCGGTPTLEELAAFSQLERQAFAQAADRVRVREVLDLAAALSGQAEEVAATIDGGVSVVERDLALFADQLEESLS
jgi:hypothetical protein